MTDQPEDEPVFHEEHPAEQQVTTMRRTLRRWSSASRKAWRSRKTLAQTRAALAAAAREPGE